MAHDNELIRLFPASQNPAQTTPTFVIAFKLYQEVLPKIKKAIENKNESLALTLLNNFKEKITSQITANLSNQQFPFTTAPTANVEYITTHEFKNVLSKIAEQDFSLIIEAAHQGLEEVVKTLLIDYKMCTPDSIPKVLYTAVKQGHLNIVKLVIETFFSQSKSSDFFIQNPIQNIGFILWKANQLAIQYQKNDIVLFLNHMIDIETVIKRIEENDSSLIYLYLDHCSINEQQAQRLFKALQNNTVLNTIDLSQIYSITVQSLPHIIEMLEKNKRLITIKLYDWEINTSISIMKTSVMIQDRFCQFIKNLINSTKTSQYFDYIEDEIEDIIIGIMSKQLKNIKICSLDFISYQLPILSEYIEFLLKNIVNAGSLKVASKLLALDIINPIHIQNDVFYVSKNGKNYYDVFSIAILNNNLKMLDFVVKNGCNPVHRHKPHIEDPLQIAINTNHIVMVDFLLSRGLFSYEPNLNIPGNLTEIAKLIHEKTQFNYLIKRLTNNEPEFTHVYLLGYILKNNPQILSSILSQFFDALKSNTTVTYLDLSECSIDDTHITLLVNILQKNKNITYLNLSNNNITSTGLNELSKILGENSSITYLDLCDNKEIMEDSLKNLSDILKTNTQLKSLKVSSNYITTSTSKYFANTLKENTTLLEFDFDNTLNDDLSAFIAEAFDELCDESLKCNLYFNKTQHELSMIKNKLFSSKQLSQDEFDFIHFTLLNMQTVCELMEKKNYSHTQKLRDQIYCVAALFYKENDQVVELIRLYLEYYFPDYHSDNCSVSYHQIALILAQTLINQHDKFTDENNMRKLIILLGYKNQEEEAQNIFNQFYFSFKYPEKRGYNYTSETIASMLGKITDSDIQELFHLPQNYSLKDELLFLLSQFLREVCMYQMQHQYTSADPIAKEPEENEHQMSINSKNRDDTFSSNSSSTLFATKGQKRTRKEDVTTSNASTIPQNPAGDVSNDSSTEPPNKKIKTMKLHQ